METFFSLYQKQVLPFCYTLLFILAFIYYPRWYYKHTEAVISWDVYQHYLYLPALFIHQDIKDLKTTTAIASKYLPARPIREGTILKQGHLLLQKPVGLAVCFAPAFLVAHVLAMVGGWPMDGFSLPYQWILLLYSICVHCLGMHFLYKALNRLGGSTAATWIIVFLICGTHVLNYASIDAANPMMYSFTLIAFLLYACVQLENTFHWKWVFMITGTIGLLILIHPPQIISLCFVLTWLLGIPACRKKFGGILAILVPGIIILYSFQFWYVFTVGGTWAQSFGAMPYFKWSTSQLWEVFFGWQKGWWLYTPLLILMLPGHILLRQYHPRHHWVAILLLFIFLTCFITGNPLYMKGGGLGFREWIPYYPLFAITGIPLFRYLEKSAPWKQWCTSILLLTILCYNAWLIHQAHRGGILEAGQMNATYFQNLWSGNLEKQKDKLFLDQVDRFTGTIQKEELIYSNNFESRMDSMFTKQNALTGFQSLQLDKTHQLTPDLWIPFNAYDMDWVRLCFDCNAPQKEWDTWLMTQAVLQFKFDNYVLKENFVRMHRVCEDGKTAHICFDAKVPDFPLNNINILFWNAGSKKTILIDNVTLIGFRQEQ